MDIKVLAATFGIVFLAELGDKTQLAAFAFTTKTGSSLSVFLGTALALITAAGIAVFLGDLMQRFLPQKALVIMSASLFVLIGLLLLVNLARKAPDHEEDSSATEKSSASRPFGVKQENASPILPMLLKQASRFEQRNADFYKALAAEVTDPCAREILHRIAEEDASHARGISDVAEDGEVAASEVPALTNTEMSLPEVPQVSRDCAAPSGQKQTASEEAIRQAIKNEEASAEFYLALAREAWFHRVRDSLRWLSQRNLLHAQSLCNLVNHPAESPYSSSQRDAGSIPDQPS